MTKSTARKAFVGSCAISQLAPIPFIYMTNKKIRRYFTNVQIMANALRQAACATSTGQGKIVASTQEQNARAP